MIHMLCLHKKKNLFKCDRTSVLRNIYLQLLHTHNLNKYQLLIAGNMLPINYLNIVNKNKRNSK